MMRAITIDIGDLALPGVAAADVPRVLAALEAEVGARLDATRMTGASVASLSVSPPAGTSPDAIGRLLGAALAQQLHGDAP